MKIFSRLKKKKQKPNPSYSYQVWELVPVMNSRKFEPSYQTKDFTGPNLLACRRQAYSYFLHRMLDLENQGFIVLTCTPDDFLYNKHHRCLVGVRLVEWYNEDECYTYELVVGTEADNIDDNVLFEESLFLHMSKLN
jgi:hypothetical protein